MSQSKTNSLHPNNQHQGYYDLPALCKSLPALADVILQNPAGHDTIDFSNPLAVKLLNKALLLRHYNLDYWDIPDGFLCPPIPSRADYIHHLAEQLSLDNAIGADGKKGVRALDIGTGANLIYPIIGSQVYGWRFVATDIDPLAIENAKCIIETNRCLKNKVKLKLQKNAQHMFKGVVSDNDQFDVSICNPPFHASLAEAMASNQRKQKNLKHNKNKRDTKIVKARIVKSWMVKQAPQSKSPLNFGGQKAELWCDGGEIAFLKRMVVESQQFSAQIGWFTTLVSKADNLAPLTRLLNKLGVTRLQQIQMKHGQKTSRVLAWGW